MARIYFDTSFFIGFLENQGNRRAEASRILDFEKSNDRFTSELTLNEFLVRTYDRHRDSDDCESKVGEKELEVRSIARVVAISGQIHREAARLQSLYGQLHRHSSPPPEPRDRKFRWDALHLATAFVLKCSKIYAWDGKWEKLPADIKKYLDIEIIAPARVDSLFDLP